MKKTEEKVINFIRDYNLISSGDRILVALSGGADSVFLLHFLHKFKKKYKLELGALHVNHLIRGKSAVQDEQFCAELCKELGVEYYSVKKNVKQIAARRKISVEEAGRNVRYDQLEKTAQKNKYTKIATAHNSGDNTETVLLNLIKGTGLKGLSGIPHIRGSIIRPILPLKKDEITAYLDKNSIKYVVDETNDFDDYERNFLRNTIIPQLKSKLNPSLEDAVFNTSFVIKTHYNDISAIVEEFYSRYLSRKGGKVFIKTDLMNENEAVRIEFLKFSIERNFSVQLSFKDIRELKKLFLSTRGSKINLLSGLKAFRESDEVVIFRENIIEFTPLKLKLNEKVRLNDKYLSVSETEKRNFTIRKQGEEYIAADDIDSIFVVRKWREGDHFFPLGMKGSKKVSDFLNEKKIASHVKHKNLVLTNRDRIVWIIGLRLDNRFRITEKTKSVVKLCLK